MSRMPPCFLGGQGVFDRQAATVAPRSPDGEAATDRAAQSARRPEDGSSIIS
jgi:hypothetical protein